MIEIFVVVVPLLTFWFVYLQDGRVRRLVREVDRLSQKADLLMEHFGIEEPEPVGIADVDALVRRGELVKAIKRYRELTGVDLVEAKTAVDRRQARLQTE